MIRETYVPDPHQSHATAHIQQHRGTGLFLEMGLGKTVATLTAIIEMMKRKEIKKTIVIAPLTVARDVWSDEIDKWEHTESLRYSLILGNAKERLAALNTEADVYVINWENLAWLIAELNMRWPFDYTVIDESSKFKSAKSKCFKAMRTMLPRIKKITILTGTPRPNSLMDLWSQLFLIDNGERLFKTIGEYRRTYFKEGLKKGHIVYNYEVKKEDDSSLLGGEIWAEEIYDKISDICISMEAKDYAELPECLVRTKTISLPDKVMCDYKQFEKDLVLEIANEEITAANAAVMAGKLLQYSNGAIYDDKKAWHKIHDAKLEALEEIMEEANGAPVLVMYQYKHDLARILERFKGFSPRIIKDTQSKRDWNTGKIKMGIGHAASMGHGNNLQAGGSVMVWFGLGWSLELYDQANKRLHRRGQTKPVYIYHLLTKGTMDGDVLHSLTQKRKGQSGCMRAVKAKVLYYKNLGTAVVTKQGELVL
jgi:SNF2 family DNA or RNA helicase